jgi:hypothetical protein
LGARHGAGAGALLVRRCVAGTLPDLRQTLGAKAAGRGGGESRSAFDHRAPAGIDGQMHLGRAIALDQDQEFAQVHSGSSRRPSKNGALHACYAVAMNIGNRRCERA